MKIILLWMTLWALSPFDDNLISKLVSLFAQQVELPQSSGCIHWHSFQDSEGDDVLQIGLYPPHSSSLDSNVSASQDDKLVYPDDCPLWKIVFTDSCFNRYLTRKTLIEEDISDIESIMCELKVKFVEEDWTDGKVFSALEVDHPPHFSGEADLVDKIIKDSFMVADSIDLANLDRIPFVIELLIGPDGNARVVGILKKTDSERYNFMAIEAVEKICEYPFIPATHRGKAVACRYAIPISRRTLER